MSCFKGLRSSKGGYRKISPQYAATEGGRFGAFLFFAKRWHGLYEQWFVKNKDVHGLKKTLIKKNNQRKHPTYNKHLFEIL